MPILKGWCIHLLAVFGWIWVASTFASEYKYTTEQNPRGKWINAHVFTTANRVCWIRRCKWRQKRRYLLPPRQQLLNVNSIATLALLEYFFIGWQKSKRIRLLTSNTKCARCSVREKCWKNIHINMTETISYEVCTESEIDANVTICVREQDSDQERECVWKWNVERLTTCYSKCRLSIAIREMLECVQCTMYIAWLSRNTVLSALF